MARTYFQSVIFPKFETQSLWEMHEIEPFYGWLAYYNTESDARNPFHDAPHDAFTLDKGVYEYLAHPLWEDIGSDSLLAKVLYAHYDQGYAIIELLGVWNDLLQNDYKLLAENCLTYFIDQGINQFVLITENVLNIYLDADDYYEAVQEELEDGWICLLRPREHVVAEIEEYGIGRFFFWSDELDAMHWRKLKPWELHALAASKLSKLLP